VGLRDFESFAASDRGVIRNGAEGSGDPSTLVLVDRLDIGEAGDLVLIGIEGSHFLWKMVRRVVGVLVEIGRGGLDPAAAASFLSTSSDAPARLTAPASGLFLERVYYTADARGSHLRAITPVATSSPEPSPSRIGRRE
jgi:tRNA pseudouridine38-40 synthase